MTHLGRGQVAPGLKRVRWTPGSTIQVVAREGMLSNLLFPADETLTNRLVSDSGSFEVILAPDHHSASVRPIFIGVDASLNVYGSSGNLYSFYLRSVPWDNPTIADSNVSISVAGMTDVVSASDAISSGSGGSGGSLAGAVGGGYGAGSTSGSASNAAINGAAYDDDPSARLTLRPRALSTRAGKEFAATASTGNGRIRTDLRILAPSKADAIIAPVAAWRDDRFTYLDFGPRSTSMNEWPVAALVVDRTESPIGTRVAGPNRSVMVVEGIGNVTLRSGSHIICVEVNLQDNDPRSPVVDEPYANRRGRLQVGADRHLLRAPPLGVTGAGSGDYDGDLPATRINATTAGAPIPLVGPNPMQAAMTGDVARLRIASGPYDDATATSLAGAIRSGYRGAPAAAAEVVDAGGGVGAGDERDAAAGRTSEIRTESASASDAVLLCAALHRFNHSCRPF